MRTMQQEHEDIPQRATNESVEKPAAGLEIHSEAHAQSGLSLYELHGDVAHLVLRPESVMLGDLKERSHDHDYGLSMASSCC